MRNWIFAVLALLVFVGCGTKQLHISSPGGVMQTGLVVNNSSYRIEIGSPNSDKVAILNHAKSDSLCVLPALPVRFPVTLYDDEDRKIRSFFLKHNVNFHRKDEPFQQKGEGLVNWDWYIVITDALLAEH